MTQNFYRVIPIITTDLGNATFEVPPPDGQNVGWQGTLTVISGASGTFTATSGGGAVTWGTWNGSTPYGPVTVQANDTLFIAASGLLPNTQYLLQVLGIADFVEQLPAQIPTAIGSSGLVGTDQILNFPALSLPSPSSQTYEWFPCINFAALRLSAKLATGGPVRISAEWANSDATADMGDRSWLISQSAPEVQFVIPHLGDQLKLTAANATTGTLLPTLVDSSGNGNNGSYDPDSSGLVNLQVPGGVTGDTAASIMNVISGGDRLAKANISASPFSGSFFLRGWFTHNSANPASCPIVQCLPTGLGEVSLIWAANTLACLRAYDTIGGEDNVGVNGAISNGLHEAWVVYNAGADTFQFYLDGAVFGSAQSGTGHTTSTFVATHLFIGENVEVATGSTTYDEVAGGAGVVSGGTIGTIFADRGNFATYSAAILALTPTFYYHLDDAATGGPATLSLCATHTTQPLAMWGGQDIAFAITQTVADSTPTVLLQPPYVFGGPAHLDFDPDGSSSAYVMQMQAQQSNGTWQTIFKRSNLDSTVNVRQSIDFFAPAQPLQLIFEQTTGSSHSVDATLTYDLHRVG